MPESNPKTGRRREKSLTRHVHGPHRDVLTHARFLRHIGTVGMGQERMPQQKIALLPPNADNREIGIVSAVEEREVQRLVRGLLLDPLVVIFVEASDDPTG
eukprot:SAG31_NODE_259_length_18917_cov_28.559677_13_plen_101_part_00